MASFSRRRKLDHSLINGLYAYTPGPVIRSGLPQPIKLNVFIPGREQYIFAGKNVLLPLQLFSAGLCRQEALLRLPRKSSAGDV